MSNELLISLADLQIAVIIPCYNEEKTIAQVIDEIFHHLPQAHVAVFDNNSSDNSREIVLSKIEQYRSGVNNVNSVDSGNGAELNNAANTKDTTYNTQNTIQSNASRNSRSGTLSLHHVVTQGKGAVMREAFALLEADMYVMIDADTEHDASILPYALNYFKSHHLDMLNIARESDSNIYRPGHSFGNKLFSKSVQLIFGTKINDMLSGYRIFSRPFVKSFPAHSNGFEIETELTIHALEQKMRTGEIKAPYKSRPEGSFSKLSTFKDGFKISLMILRLLFSERPLLVFGVLSAICLCYHSCRVWVFIWSF